MTEQPANARRRVVVLGAGYAGLTCFLELQDRLPRSHDLVLVSRDRYHWFTTELHTYAAGHDPDTVRIPLRRLVAPPGRLVIDHVAGLRPAERRVELKISGPQVYDLLVWAGGVRGHSLLAEAGLELGGRGRARVDAFLRSVSDDRIYVIGDAASFTDPVSGREVPPTGQAAVQMGKAAAENILRRLSGQPEQPFAFRLRGQFASLGHHEGVGTLGQENLVGLPAVAVKHFVEGLHAWEMGGGVMPLVRKLVAAPLNYLRGRRLRQRLRPRRALREQPP